MIMPIFMPLIAIFNETNCVSVSYSYNLPYYISQKVNMDWFCSCLPKVDESATIQAFKRIGSSLLIGQMKTVIQPGRGTATNSINTMLFTQTDRIKPIQLPSKTNGYVSVKELKKDAGDRTVFRKIIKSKYEEIKEICRKTNTKYTDDDFLNANKKTIYTWKRLPEIIPDATFMKHPVGPTNILQGLINDCDFMSAVASLAERDYRIKNLFGELELSPHGVYMCRLTFNGIYQEVVVDDYLPLDKDGQLIFAHPYKDTDCWTIILEKCWAKLLGNYGLINLRSVVNSTSDALYSLACAPVRVLQLIDYKRVSSNYDRLLKQMKRNELFVQTCFIRYKQPYENQNDLQSGQVYSVLGIYTLKVNRETIELIQLRNPLGKNGGVVSNKNDPNAAKRFVPRLPYGPKDPFWDNVDKKTKQMIQYQLIQKEWQGVFFMDFRQFMLYYDELSICQIDDNCHYLFETATFENFQAKYINLKVDKVTAPFYLLLAQKSIRRTKLDPLITKDNPYPSISVLVARVEKDFQNRDTFVYISSKGYNHYATSNHFPSNYFPVDLGITTKGHYLIRILVHQVKVKDQKKAPQNNPQNKDEARESIQKPKEAINTPKFNPIQLTIGYYSPDDFSASFQQNIDDTQFLQRVLLNRASKVQMKQKTRLTNADGWWYIQNIRGSNLCYIAYRIESTSSYKSYRITIDEVKNQSRIFFLGSRYGEQAFTVDVPRGNQIIFIYMYTTQLPDTDVVPNVVDNRKLPDPKFTPIQP